MKILLGLLFFATAASAISQVLPGRDAFVVHRPEQHLSTGRTLPASALVVERPTDAYMPGVIIVKTRGSYGQVTKASKIEGSTVQSTLNTLDISEVTSTYPTPGNASAADVKLASEIGLDRIYTITFSDPIDAFDVCLRMMANPDVEYAMPMIIHKQSFIPNDALYNQQTWMKNMKIEDAWDESKGSSSVIIAIVDSGTDWMHEDLSAKIKMNSKEVPGNGKDDDQNGYVDDVRGWDFVGNVSAQEAYAGVLRPDNDPRVSFGTINGTNGHGTMTAGCAAANTNNGIGVAGTGFNCMILPIKVGSDNPQVGGLLAGYKGVKYAADMGAQIINCSWGGTTPDPGGQDLMNYCLAKGALVVAASGNDGLFTDATPHYPSSFAGVLSVGASTSSNAPSYFSNYGYDVTTYAPGENILTTFQNNTYQSTNGTSFSSPFVAGICGLIKSKHPEWTPEMIIQQVRSTSDPMQGVTGSNRPKYYGCVNASKALRYNASFSSGDRIPGIDMLSMSAGATGQITTYDPVNVDIVLKNYLGDATDVKLTVEPLGGAVDITGNKSVAVPTVLHDATTTLNLTVKLKPTYPWYEANQQFMITVQSGSYLNYILVRIPVKLPTSNSHVTVSSSQYLSFDLADFTADGTLWTTGTYLSTNAVFAGTKSGISGVLAAPFKPTTICGVSGTMLMLGGQLSGKPTIAVTTNAKDWTPIDVSTSMSSVAGIAMIDGQLGFAFGNPVGGKIGLAKTTDGGITWSKVNNGPTSNTGETILPHVFHSNSKGVWFATSARRIISTINRGANWSSTVLPTPTGSEIKSIAVDTLLNGAAVYKNGSNYYVALSEAGSVWKSDAVNSSALGIVPAAVASPGKNLVLVGSNGEVFGSDNAGKDWQVILSRSPMTVTRAVAKTSGSTTLVTTGLNVGLLTYKYSGPNGTRIASLASDVIDYGTLESGQNRLRSIRVESTGESSVAITSRTLTPDASTPADAFRIVTEIDSIIEAGSSDNLGVRLYATTVGAYSATVTFTTNAQTNSTLSCLLKATVQEPVSVNDFTVSHTVRLYPNPSSSELMVELPADATLDMYNVNGELVAQLGSYQAGNQSLSVASLIPGTYQLRIRFAHEEMRIPFVRIP